ncbi:TPA: hypothetical protein SLV11_005855 [Pseudomonas aeruginosa]|nr:hypothetical protein [Pseudomonas aeruginosa]
MSKQSHTPGPWEIERYSDGLIQIVGNIHAVSEHEEHVTTVVEEVTRGDEANARLIAAAPDLLESLENLMAAYSQPEDRICCNGVDCGCMGATTYQQAEHYARAAIAKATA